MALTELLQPQILSPISTFKGGLMFATRWNPFGRNIWNQVQQMQDEMNRLFDRWGDGRAGFATFPAVNVWEESDALYVQAELPGLNLNDLEIFVTGNNQLTIKGERKANV